MNIPVLVLLGFAVWTLLILTITVGVYRWHRILTGRSSIAEWRADLPQGSEWYQRGVRAHMNCVENLPVYTAIVVAVIATGSYSVMLDRLAVTILAARMAQTLVHITLRPTNSAAALRFALYFVQVACMLTMAGLVASASAIGPPDAHMI
jgi:uncharacterized MAPEG superfamily protein